MAKLTARNPKGMRDFLPADMIKRDYIFRVIRDVFESFGFEPIDTPVLELREVLQGSNYGSEAEKLIYYAQHAGGKEELALRYDLTVPLSRFFAQNENQLNLPFRRYHIAPVWRGDRPQKGRYREFYQCDADIVGVSSMTADAEVMSVVYTALQRLGFEDFSIKVNNRKLLTGIGIYAGIPDHQLPYLYRAIDKTDKIGLDGVAEEMTKEGIPAETVNRMISLLRLDGSGNLSQRLGFLANLREELDNIPIAMEALGELEELTHAAAAFGVPDTHTAFDLTMVRGLGYYTGPIFETIITKPDNLGAVQGGGRYDELIGLFRGQTLPTTGISLGIERIVDLLDMLNLYPAEIGGTVVQTLVTVFNEDFQTDSISLTRQLRSGGVRAELFMDGQKGLGKQIGYADKKGIRLVIIMGPDEKAKNEVRIKRLADGYEENVGIDKVVESCQKLLRLQ